MRLRWVVASLAFCLVIGFTVAVIFVPSARSADPKTEYLSITGKQVELVKAYQAKQDELRQLENQFNRLEGARQLLLKQNPGLLKQIQAEAAVAKPLPPKAKP